MTARAPQSQPPVIIGARSRETMTRPAHDDAPRSSTRQKPLRQLLRACWLLLSGRLHAGGVAAIPAIEDHGELFDAFRRVTLDPPVHRGQAPGAIFRVRFRFKNLSPRTNRLLSLIPIPLIVAQPGFRSKTWRLGQRTGDFMGHYEFESVAAAEAYWSSLPLRMMRRRAAPGSLHYEVCPITAGGPALDSNLRAKGAR